jgi:enolase-phosphatase E1
VIFSLLASGVHVVLLDIEGTTTPIDFVTGVLFPFARDRARSSLEVSLASDPEIARAIATLREERDRDAASGHAPPRWHDEPADARLDSAVAYIHWLMDRDRKLHALKLLQGRVWEQGYLSGTLRGAVYPDVPGALERWTAAGLSVGVFSSGRVLAQKLLFAHSIAGDLTPLLRWHFDTAVGPKVEPSSYRLIAAVVAAPPACILFISDVTKELEAAEAAGVQTLLCIRPPAARPAASDRYRVVHTFDEVLV